MNRFLRPFICLMLLFFASSWGFLTHRTINQLAVYELPRALQPFFFNNMEYVVKHSVRPDQRRNDDSTEATKHFIDCEIYGDSAAWKMPLHWKDAVAKYSKDTLIKYGYVPYHIVFMKEALTNAFRNKNKDSILFYAADLAHYVGDAHVPLHTSINYDGQLTNQKGLHALWETVVPEILLTEYNLSSRHKATYIKDPALAAWGAVRSGFVLLNDVFAMELKATESFTDSTKYRIQIRNGREVKYYTSAFAKEYSRLLGNTINEKLIQSADLVADFWYTSWVDAGKPDVSDLLSNQWNKSQKTVLKQEIKAFRANQLISKNWLIAKKASN